MALQQMLNTARRPTQSPHRCTTLTQVGSDRSFPTHSLHGTLAYLDALYAGPHMGSAYPTIAADAAARYQVNQSV